ncbi:DUF2089 domain-containing protein [Ornithinibacillus californiensis]|uniref:DUF2089 domain-containing protein n=1 Tax=Ornithinibacillus californiensis TaxID=161536 RepID=UPI00064DB375|nr:DUF2089 domain-containing protein [Ornithinibacillus californiensis]
MAHTLLTNCPVCSNTLIVSKLQCNHCDTTIENEFELSKFNILSTEQLQFIETFIVSRGNIKEVEKELGISYPTVRGKLNDIIKALGYESETKQVTDERKIVDMLERGEITPEEAINQLKK